MAELEDVPLGLREMAPPLVDNRVVQVIQEAALEARPVAQPAQGVCGWAREAFAREPPPRH
eukprot:3391043-Alexandrium_andersonii.AAC.1